MVGLADIRRSRERTGSASVIASMPSASRNADKGTPPRNAPARESIEPSKIGRSGSAARRMKHE